MAAVASAGPSSTMLILLPPPKPLLLPTSTDLKSKKLCLGSRTWFVHVKAPLVLCSSKVATVTSHLRTVKKLLVLSGIETIVLVATATSWLSSDSSASPLNHFPDLSTIASSLDPPDPCVTPSFCDSSSPALSDLRQRLGISPSGLYFVLVTSSVLVRRFTALCIHSQKIHFWFLSSCCYDYQVRLWCFKLLSISLLSEVVSVSSLGRSLVIRLIRNSKSMLDIFACWFVMAPVKDTLLCRPWLRLCTMCHYYSLVEMLVSSYPPYGRNVCVTGIQVFIRVVKLSYSSLYDMVCWFNNAFEVLLLNGLLRFQLVTLVLLVESNIMISSWESLPSLSLDLYDFEAENVSWMLALGSAFVLSNFSVVWGFVAFTREAEFQVAISFSLKDTSPNFASLYLLVLSNGLNSLYNINGMEARGHLFVFNCESVLFASIFYFCFLHY